MAELGYVGLGVMGSAIVRRLLGAGHTVAVWNRSREKAEPLLEAGAVWADSPRAAAERSDVVFTMVTNTAAVQAVCEGPDGILAGLGAGNVPITTRVGARKSSRAVPWRRNSGFENMRDRSPPDHRTICSLEPAGRVLRMTIGTPDRASGRHAVRAPSSWRRSLRPFSATGVPTQTSRRSG